MGKSWLDLCFEVAEPQKGSCSAFRKPPFHNWPSWLTHVVGCGAGSNRPRLSLTCSGCKGLHCPMVCNLSYHIKDSALLITSNDDAVAIGRQDSGQYK